MSQTSSRAPEARLRDRQDDGTHFTELVALRDFLRVHLPSLTEAHRMVIQSFLDGAGIAEIAAAEGVSTEAIHNRLRRAMLALQDRWVREVNAQTDRNDGIYYSPSKPKQKELPSVSRMTSPAT